MFRVTGTGHQWVGFCILVPAQPVTVHAVVVGRGREGKGIVPVTRNAGRDCGGAGIGHGPVHVDHLASQRGGGVH